MAQRDPLALVVAMTRARVIGRDGTIPWHHAEDMKHFRRVTLGHAVIMGRATYDSIAKPLAKRRNIVVSRDPGLRIEGCNVVSSLAAAIALGREHDDEPRVIGGAQIYAAALPLATRLFLTYLDAEHEGDCFFPAFDPREWVEEEHKSAPGLTWSTLVRRQPDAT
jgi:dihydrofolate reductase